MDVVAVEGRCTGIGTGADGCGGGVDDDGFPSAVASANADVVCDAFLCFPPWFLKGENRLWKGEERGDRGDLDSTGDTPGETVSAVSESSTLRKAAPDSDWDCAWA